MLWEFRSEKAISSTNFVDTEMKENAETRKQFRKNESNRYEVTRNGGRKEQGGTSMSDLTNCTNSFSIHWYIEKFSNKR